jgi:hypothetical protein
MERCQVILWPNLSVNAIALNRSREVSLRDGSSGVMRLAQYFDLQTEDVYGHPRVQAMAWLHVYHGDERSQGSCMWFTHKSNIIRAQPSVSTSP